MKIAVVTDNGTGISRHFGRAPYYLVFTVEAGQIAGKQQLDKVGHQHSGHEVHLHDAADQLHERGMGAESGHRHDLMLAPILDCAAVIAGGMGRGAYLAIEQAGMKAIITDLSEPERAVQAYLDGTLVNHLDRLH